MLSVPGDVLLGAAASGQHRNLARSAGLTASSCSLYLAGMALNDYADREVDAVERPGRPIPSGRVTPGFALGVAGGLTALSAALALAADGPRAAALAAPLTAAVWAYDLALTRAGAGVAGMAACRALDVLAGAGAHGARRALAPAALIAAHTAVVTAVSQREAQGAPASLPLAALAATGGLAAAAGAFAARRSDGGSGRRAAALLAAYAGAVGPGYARAARDASPQSLQKAVGAGVLGLVPLQATLLAATGRRASALGVAALWPAARTLARRRSVT
jgi:4-hydroxybenzoate polyprenyltransferase